MSPQTTTRHFWNTAYTLTMGLHTLLWLLTLAEQKIGFLFYFSALKSSWDCFLQVASLCVIFQVDENILKS